MAKIADTVWLNKLMDKKRISTNRNVRLITFYFPLKSLRIYINARARETIYNPGS